MTLTSEQRLLSRDCEEAALDEGCQPSTKLLVYSIHNSLLTGAIEGVLQS
jgi:hypothetical protein